jgi:hypothetical protein
MAPEWHLRWLSTRAPGPTAGASTWPLPVPKAKETTAGVYLAYSDDQGATFSTPARVGATPTGDQFNPGLAVDATTGSVNLLWSDTSSDPERKRVNTLLARSVDGGATFGAAAKLNAAPTNEFCENPAWGDPCDADTYQLGSRGTLVSSGGTAHGFWVDRSHGQVRGEDIMTASVP